MKISKSITHIAPGSIVVSRDTRQRRDLGDLDSLAGSIRKFGVLNPIIVTRSLELIAGERRLTACIGLGLLEVPVRFIEELSEIEQKIIELEENIKRQDLSWQESVCSIAEIHVLFLALDDSWNQTRTAEELNIATSLVSMYLKVYEVFGEERVQKAGTFNEAYNIIKRRDSREMHDALAELLELPTAAEGTAQVVIGEDGSGVQAELLPGQTLAPIVVLGAILPPEKSILIEDFLKWIPSYAGSKFNFVHCDFPYGIEVFSGPQGKGAEPSAGYGDSFNVYVALMESFCRNLDRFMSISAHCVFWYSEKHRDVTRKIFQQLAPTLEIHQNPLIWVKSNNAGVASDPRHGPRHIYETALFISRGKRQICQVVADAYAGATDKLLHPSTKPEPMLRHFFTMCVDYQTTLFDPTCGSGAALRAAESLGAKRVMGLELDPQFAHSARSALGMSRMKLRAAKQVGGLG